MDKEFQDVDSSRPAKLVRYSVKSPNRDGISEVDVPNDSIINNDPLTVRLVLENIFSNLNGEDLESCKKVNLNWKSVIEQLFTRHYEVEFHTIPVFNLKRNKEVGKENFVTIRKIYWSSKLSPWKKYTVSEALEILLKKSSKDRKFAIELNLYSCYIRDYDAETFRGFVSKAGYLVHTFSSGACFETLSTFCAILGDFPNLHHLNLSSTGFDDFDNALDPSFKKQESLLKKVKKITFGDREHLKGVECLLKLAPKLEEVHDFPGILVDALISKGVDTKGFIVKSLTYPIAMDHQDETEDDFKIALNKFALLAPKLRSFSFLIGEECEDVDYDDDESVWPGILNYRQTCYPVFRKILESSQQSLEDLTICLPGNFDFNLVSPMTSLKKIKLLEGKNFPWNEKIPSYLRLQIEEIIMDVANGNSDDIRELGNSFGSLKRLGFSYELDQLDRPILPLIAEFWPEIEVLIIDLEGSLTSPLSFDSVFTGIPDSILAQLKGPIGRGIFTGDEMASFHAKSTLRKLSKLKKLELNVGNLDVPREVLDKKLRTITSLSKEFCFDFMSPTFQLVISELSTSGSLSDLEEALSGVVTFAGSPY